LTGKFENERTEWNLWGVNQLLTNNIRFRNTQLNGVRIISYVQTDGRADGADSKTRNSMKH